MRYSFDAAVAARYGMEEAVLLDHIHFWCEKNRDKQAFVHHGRSWMYATAAQMARHFSFWNVAKIRRLVKSLVEQGALLTGRFNRSAYDRTLWYAVSDAAASMLQICRMESSEPCHSTGETGAAIKDTQENTQQDTQQDPQHTGKAAPAGGPRACFSPLEERESKGADSRTKPESRPAAGRVSSAQRGGPEGFERFWQIYPRKEDKKSALRAWKALKPDAPLVETMVAALALQRESAAWKESGGRYIPHPARWLGHRRWEDAPPAPRTPARTMPAWAQTVSRPFDPDTVTDILARRRPPRLKRAE